LNLYILQHGEAEPKEVNPERPLSGQGVRDIRALAIHMQNMGVQLESIFHSGKLRAEQSARLIAEVLSPDIKPVQATSLNPNDDPTIVSNAIELMGGNILVASHMPFVSHLCSHLLSGSDNVEFASLPGTLFCLEKTDDKWRMAWMLRPDCL
jgi:phosphohistidine phosphatase